MTQSPLTYKDAGVDISAGDKLVADIRGIAERTHRPGVMTGLGGFSGLFELPVDRYKHPVLVSGTDGVGTKLKLAMMAKKHDTIGIDLVAMCVNDVITCGAEPLFFLDYYATGHLNATIASQVIASIGEGCEQANCSLIGGETAEMPGMYSGQDYDLAGFCVGVVEKDQIIDNSTVQPGDALIALASSGVHSNGFSLVRKVLEFDKTDIHRPFDDTTLANVLLRPTRVYVNAIQALIKSTAVKAIAHITGGGLLDNIPRVLPETCCATIDTSSWEVPGIFQWLQVHGNIADAEMWRTFNCGAGMVVCVSADQVDNAIGTLTAAGETAWQIGEITTRDQDAIVMS